MAYETVKTSASGWKKGQSGNPAGRKPGEKVRVSIPLLRRVVADTVQNNKESPLDFLLRVMRDPKQSIKDRLYAAVSAAPYLHARMPLALEGGDRSKPILVETQRRLEKLSDSEIAAFLTTSAKLGHIDPDELGDLAPPLKPRALRPSALTRH